MSTSNNGEWTIHFRHLCEDRTCTAGDVLIHNEPKQYFDAECWTEDDFFEFSELSYSEQVANAEQMREIDWYGNSVEVPA